MHISGSGSFDAGVIKACVSDLEHYIGVEPDKDMHDSLTANMKDLNGVKVIICTLLYIYDNMFIVNGYVYTSFFMTFYK